jgi:hypothetical protein
MMSHNDDVVLLRRFGYLLEGELARTTLEAAGIESALLGDEAGGWQPAMRFANPARLLVRREDADEARAVLEEAGLYP